MTNRTKYEMETVVNYNVEEQTAIVYIRDKSVMCRLDRLVADYPESYKLLNQTEIFKTYSIPKSYPARQNCTILEGTQGRGKAGKPPQRGMGKGGKHHMH